MKRVLVTCLGTLAGDPRPRRAAETCRQLGFDVVVADRFRSPIRSGRVQLLLRLLARVVPVWAGKWKLLDRVTGIRLPAGPFDLVIVEDIGLLPAAFRVAAGSPVLFDAREYYPRQDDTNFWFRLLDRQHRVMLCRDYMTRCAAVVTVSPGIAAEYARKFGVEPVLVRSVPPYVEAAAGATGPQSIRMVHHGVANPSRGLEAMLEVMQRLDERFTLDLYLTGDAAYIAQLRAKAQTAPRVQFREPVPYAGIVEMLREYDIGLYPVQPGNFNIIHCLPNKLFEFIQARLAVAISPTKDMADVVRQYGCGVVAPDFEPASMAAVLRALTPDAIDTYKYASDIAAHELCFEVEGKKLSALIERLAA